MGNKVNKQIGTYDKLQAPRNERAHLSKLVRKSAYASIKKPKCYRFR